MFLVNSWFWLRLGDFASSFAGMIAEGTTIQGDSVITGMWCRLGNWT